MNKKRLLTLSGIIISLIFLYFALKGINFSEVKNAFHNANYFWIIPGLLVYILTYLVRAWRWKFILLPIKNCKIKNLFADLIIGFMANNILPLRIGEIVRAYINGENEKISKSSSFATIVVERVFDGIILFLILITIILLSPFPSWANTIAWTAAGIFLGILVIMYLLLIKERASEIFLKKIFFFLPDKWKEKIISLFSSFVAGLKILKKRKEIIATIFLSIIVWLGEGLTLFLIAQAMQLNLSYVAACFTLTIISLGIILPSSPGFVGVYEFFGVLALGIYQIEKSPALSFIILLHFLQFAFIVSAGFIFLIKRNISIKELRQRSAG